MESSSLRNDISQESEYAKVHYHQNAVHKTGMPCGIGKGRAAVAI